MKCNNTPHNLARLETGFRTDPAHLKKLEDDLIAMVRQARDFGENHPSSDDWNKRWHRHWDDVERLLHQVRLLVTEMHDSLEGGDGAHLNNALLAWRTLQIDGADLVRTLTAIRAQKGSLDASVWMDWDNVNRVLEAQFELIYASAQAIRVRIELLQGRSKVEVDRLVQDLLSKLPRRMRDDGMDAASYEREYGKAVLELEKEKHEVLGVMDDIKSLFMWFETPEERMRQNLAIPID